MRVGDTQQLSVKDQFLLDFNLKKENKDLQDVGIELLYLCLVELNKLEKNRAFTSREIILIDESRTLKSRVFKLASYWVNDLEYLFLEELKKKNPKSRFFEYKLNSRGKNMNSFDRIYEWLYNKYNIRFYD